MDDSALQNYLREIWYDPDGSQQRHLALREQHTVSLTDNAPGTLEWAAPCIAAHLKQAERALDIGCGGAQYLEFLLARPDLLQFGVGLDRHLRVSDQTRQRLQTGGRGALVQGDALALPFPDRSFTAAMANRMLNQTGDIARALSEAARVLKSGGLFFVVTADSEQGALLRQIHRAAQEQCGFPPALYRSRTRPGQRLNLQNGPRWLSPLFKDIQLERYERVLVFEQLADLMEYYATGLLFHQATSFEDAEVNPALWFRLYRMVEARLQTILATEGKVEIRDGAALFTATSK